MIRKRKIQKSRKKKKRRGRGTEDGGKSRRRGGGGGARGRGRPVLTRAAMHPGQGGRLPARLTWHLPLWLSSSGPTTSPDQWIISYIQPLNLVLKMYNIQQEKCNSLIKPVAFVGGTCLAVIYRRWSTEMLKTDNCLIDYYHSFSYVLLQVPGRPPACHRGQPPPPPLQAMAQYTSLPQFL